MLLIALLLTPPGDAPQVTPEIQALIKRLGGPDWLDQAKAAVELRDLGDKVLGPLAAQALSDSASIRYWAGAITDAVKGKGAPAAAPPPAAKAPEPAGKPVRDVNPNFNVSERDSGSLVFVCNNTRHGDYEVVVQYCPVCAKRKRFSFDYSTNKHRCGVCKVAMVDLRCNLCGQPRNPRRPLQVRPR